MSAGCRRDRPRRRCALEGELGEPAPCVHGLRLWRDCRGRSAAVQTASRGPRLAGKPAAARRCHTRRSWSTSSIAASASCSVVAACTTSRAHCTRSRASAHWARTAVPAAALRGGGWAQAKGTGLELVEGVPPAGGARGRLATAVVGTREAAGSRSTRRHCPSRTESSCLGARRREDVKATGAPRVWEWARGHRSVLEAGLGLGPLNVPGAALGRVQAMEGAVDVHERSKGHSRVS